MIYKKNCLLFYRLFARVCCCSSHLGLTYKNALFYTLHACKCITPRGSVLFTLLHASARNWKYITTLHSIAHPNVKYFVSLQAVNNPMVVCFQARKHNTLRCVVLCRHEKCVILCLEVFSRLLICFRADVIFFRLSLVLLARC